MKNYIYSFLLIFSSIIYAQKNYPIPLKSNNQLFYIQHNENKNTYVYDAVFVNKGILDTDNPVDIYRILYAENGERKPLNAIQKKLAYGLTIKNIKKNEFQLSLVSYPKQKLVLKLDANQNPFIETVINHKTIKLNRVFLKQKKGTSGLSVKLEYILFYGIDNNGNRVEEKIIP